MHVLLIAITQTGSLLHREFAACTDAQLRTGSTQCHRVKVSLEVEGEGIGSALDEGSGSVDQSH